jgi:hypothetical protein
MALLHAALATWKIPCTMSIRHQFGAVDDAASNLEYGVAPHIAMKLLSCSTEETLLTWLDT